MHGNDPDNHQPEVETINKDELANKLTDPATWQAMLKAGLKSNPDIAHMVKVLDDLGMDGGAYLDSMMLSLYDGLTQVLVQEQGELARLINNPCELLVETTFASVDFPTEDEQVASYEALMKGHKDD